MSGAYSQDGTTWLGGSFTDKCLEVLDQVCQELGPLKYLFDQPVDSKLVPDYYTVIKDPMDLGTIRQNLLSGAYSTPAEFQEVDLSGH